MFNLKKIILITLVSVAIISLSGCSTDEYDEYKSSYDNQYRVTTLFLVDEQGFTYGGIPYKCDSMRDWRTTRNNGEFTFIQPDTCTFNFNGLNGVYGDGADEVVRIVDYNYQGKGGIPYVCSDFGASSTYEDGSFSYDVNDECTFQL